MKNLFDNLIGHKNICDQLLVSVQTDRLSHALLFCGPQGIGKKRVALALLQRLVCENLKSSSVVKSEVSLLSACGECPSCQRVSSETYEHLYMLEPDSSQIKLVQIRELIRFLSFSSNQPRMVIIDKAHTMNKQAANALLKTLEEPSQNSHIVLLSPSSYGVLPTVKSRCRVLNFAPLSNQELEQLRPKDSWAFAAARGRVERYDELVAEDSLRIESAQAYLGLLSKPARSAFIKAQPLFTDLKKSLQIIYFWQFFLREAWILKIKAEERSGIAKSGEDNEQMREDQNLIEALSKQDSESLDYVWMETLELEKGLKKNFDKSLSVESYFYRVKRSLNLSKINELSVHSSIGGAQ